MRSAFWRRHHQHGRSSVMVPPGRARDYPIRSAGAATRSATRTPRSRPCARARGGAAGTLGAMPRHAGRAPPGVTAAPSASSSPSPRRCRSSSASWAGSATRLPGVGTTAATTPARRPGARRRGPRSARASTDVCNYLILGSDSRAGPDRRRSRTSSAPTPDIGGENRADTIMLVHTDPAPSRRRSSCRSRGTSGCEIPGDGEDKINAAFEGGIDGGGPQLVADTIARAHGTARQPLRVRGPRGVPGRRGDARRGRDVHPGREREHAGVGPAPARSASTTGAGYIVDPYTGLDMLPGCQLLHGDQALAYVRTRHLPCDTVPGLRPDQPPAGVPPRRDQPAAAARASCAGSARWCGRSCEHQARPGADTRRPRVPGGADAGHHHRRRGVPSVPGLLARTSWSDIRLSVVHWTLG